MSTARPVSAPVTTYEEADSLLRDLQEVMDGLIALLSAETKLVRASKLREATRLGEDKARLVKAYADATARMKANSEVIRELMPDRVDRLRRRHEAFREDLTMNMAVLSTARAVSENLLRGLAQELAAKDTTTGYGPGAGAQRPAPLRARPLAVNRSL